MLDYIKENKLELDGAAHDFICPKENGKAYMYFPIRKSKNCKVLFISQRGIAAVPQRFTGKMV